MTKMAAMPLYGKNLWNQKVDDLETWYAASGGWVLPSFLPILRQVPQGAVCPCPRAI